MLYIIYTYIYVSIHKRRRPNVNELYLEASWLADQLVDRQVSLVVVLPLLLLLSTVVYGSRAIFLTASHTHRVMTYQFLPKNVRHGRIVESL